MSQSHQWTFSAGPGSSVAAGTVRAVRVEGRMQTNSSEVIRAAVVSGMGIGFAPTWLFEPELANGAVVRLMPDWESPRSPIHLVSPPQRKYSAKVREFAAHVAHAMTLAE